jgi:hypothetical protein
MVSRRPVVSFSNGRYASLVSVLKRAARLSDDQPGRQQQAAGGQRRIGDALEQRVEGGDP